MHYGCTLSLIFFSYMRMEKNCENCSSWWAIIYIIFLCKNSHILFSAISIYFVEKIDILYSNVTKVCWLWHCQLPVCMLQLFSSCLWEQCMAPGVLRFRRSRHCGRDSHTDGLATPLMFLPAELGSQALGKNQPYYSGRQVTIQRNMATPFFLFPLLSRGNEKVSTDCNSNNVSKPKREELHQVKPESNHTQSLQIDFYFCNPLHHFFCYSGRSATTMSPKQLLGGYQGGVEDTGRRSNCVDHLPTSFLQWEQNSAKHLRVWYEMFWLVPSTHAGKPGWMQTAKRKGIWQWQ